VKRPRALIELASIKWRD